MSSHPFSELRQSYENAIAIIKPIRVGAINAAAKKLINPAALAAYEEIRKELGIPIVVQATICERESSSDFSKSPAQGDPWNRVSTHVPKGLGPYPSWKAAAIEAFKIDGLDKNSAPWSLAYACWKWEAFNGFGYRAHGIRSPYVYGGTNLQQPGKYVSDGNYDPTVMDVQLGCLPVAMEMIRLVPSLDIGFNMPSSIIPITIPAVIPVPEGAGGSLTGTKWLQDSLNKIMQPEDKLIVDGSFGRRTRALLREFQRDNGLEEDGILGNHTLKAIDERLAELH